jgi:hypothetical protein
LLGNTDQFEFLSSRLSAGFGFRHSFVIKTFVIAA